MTWDDDRRRAPHPGLVVIWFLSGLLLLWGIGVFDGEQLPQVDQLDRIPPITNATPVGPSVPSPPPITSERMFEPVGTPVERKVWGCPDPMWFVGRWCDKPDPGDYK
jgi:hypothetical protein